jgi:hypothetical protein
MPASHMVLDQVDIALDDERAVASAGLLLPPTRLCMDGRLPGEGGLEALRAKPVPGPRPKLGGMQRRRLYALIVGNDPRRCGSSPRCGPAT